MGIAFEPQLYALKHKNMSTKMMRNLTNKSKSLMPGIMRLQKLPVRPSKITVYGSLWPLPLLLLFQDC